MGRFQEDYRQHFPSLTELNDYLEKDKFPVTVGYANHAWALHRVDTQKNKVYLFDTNNIRLPAGVNVPTGPKWPNTLTKEEERGIFSILYTNLIRDKDSKIYVLQYNDKWEQKVGKQKIVLELPDYPSYVFKNPRTDPCRVQVGLFYNGVPSYDRNKIIGEWAGDEYRFNQFTCQGDFVLGQKGVAKKGDEWYPAKLLDVDTKGVDNPYLVRFYNNIPSPKEEWIARYSHRHGRFHSVNYVPHHPVHLKAHESCTIQVPPVRVQGKLLEPKVVFYYIHDHIGESTIARDSRDYDTVALMDNSGPEDWEIALFGL